MARKYTMNLDATTWRCEYYRGGGIKPVHNFRTGHCQYGLHDSEQAQQDANEKAAQNGPRQKLAIGMAADVAALIKEPDRHRSAYDALCILPHRNPTRVLPCLRTLCNHVEVCDIGLCLDDLTLPAPPQAHSGPSSHDRPWGRPLPGMPCRTAAAPAHPSRGAPSHFATFTKRGGRTHACRPAERMVY